MRVVMGGESREDQLVWISRVRINGGFLAGLDVELSEGLNVVIGPRGAGKTTLLELIRHALGVPHPDGQTASQRSKMIRDLLGDGEVVVDLRDQDASYHLVVDSEGHGRDAATLGAALVLGQNELELIASSPDSRLNLIDMRAGTRVSPPDVEHAADLTTRMSELRVEIEALRAASERRQLVREDRDSAAAQEQELLLEVSAELTERRTQLKTIDDDTLRITKQIGSGQMFGDIVATLVSKQDSLAADLEAMSNLDLGVELTAAVEVPRQALRAALDAARLATMELRLAARETSAALTSRRDSLRSNAEPIRAELEAAESGLGQVTARVRNLDIELADLDQKARRLSQAENQYARARDARNQLLDEHEQWQEDVYTARLAIANQVTNDLANRVLVEIHHLSHVEAYQRALVDLLQGSGGQYRPLAAKLSNAVLPRQLLQLAEAQDATQLASTAEIPLDRAVRALGALASPEALRVLCGLHAQDRVDFLLESEVGPKPVEKLSTGQKCAVTLPIALTEQTRALVLDQPEDHLDNGYLVANVLTALETRTLSGAQTIAATHNANIPVLGEATTVVSLTSNGEHGAVGARGPFDQEDIVKNITDIMEGGRQAFLDRAAFYNDHANVDDDSHE